MKNVVILLCLILAVSRGAKILGIMSFPAYSHQITFQPLWKELSLRGHQVTTLTTVPMKDSNLVNLTEIDLSSLNEIRKKSIREIIIASRTNLLETYWLWQKSAINFMDREFENPQVQKLIHDKNATFDLVIVEYIGPGMFAFAKRFNCPHIGITSLDPPSFVYDFVGNYIHPTLHTDSFRPYYDKNTFLGRFKSFLYFVGVNMINYFYLTPGYDALVKKHFGDGYPSVWSIAENASALLINANPVFQKVVPLLPNVVQIGGNLHREDPTQLPKEMKKILDESEGVIYFSLGTNVKNLDVPSKTQEVIMETFSQLPYTVLWKFDTDDYSNLPNNVIVSKWFPQQAVLRHRKVKLFITQGGRQSMEDAIIYNVPMIGFPFFGDQVDNVQRMVEQGYGIMLDYMNLQKDEFKSAVLEVIQNAKYRDTIKQLADLANDEQITGFERAVWWTEYVLRHKGVKHLRSVFLDVPLYQYLMLDVLGFFFFVLSVLLYVWYNLVKNIFNYFRKCRSKAKLD